VGTPVRVFQLSIIENEDATISQDFAVLDANGNALDEAGLRATGPANMTELMASMAQIGAALGTDKGRNLIRTKGRKIAYSMARGLLDVLDDHPMSDRIAQLEQQLMACKVIETTPPEHEEEE
jgi:hypothetical protein